MSTAVFSSSAFAGVATLPTSQPARVNGTHGAGVVLVGLTGFFAVAGGDRRVDHARVGVGRRRRGVVDGVGPVGERARAVGRAEGPARAVGLVHLVAVRDRHALPVAVQAGVRGQDVIGGVRDQRRVVVGQERAVVLEEVQ